MIDKKDNAWVTISTAFNQTSLKSHLWPWLMIDIQFEQVTVVTSLMLQPVH